MRQEQRVPLNRSNIVVLFVSLIMPVCVAGIVSVVERNNDPLWLSPLAAYLIVALFVGYKALRRYIRRRRAAVPQELPPPPSILIGRSSEVASALQRLIAPASDARRLLVITGPPGIGKTSLALHVAHSTISRYSDGQLYANLDARGIDPARVLDRVLKDFLRVTGVAEKEIPASLSERGALFRKVSEGKKFLIFLDDVADVDPSILLARGQDSATIITSRRALPVSASENELPLGPLLEPMAIELLAQMVGRDRLGDSPNDAATAVVRACEGHPLALQIAAAALVARPSADMTLVVSRTHTGPTVPLNELPQDADSFKQSLEFSWELLTRGDREAVLSLGKLSRRFRLSAMAMEFRLDVERARILADHLSALQFVERTTPDAAGVPIYETVEYVQDFARGRAAERHTALEVAPARKHRTVQTASDESRLNTYNALDRGKLTFANSAARDALALARDDDRDPASLTHRIQRDEGMALAGLAELRAEVGGTDEVVDLADQAWQCADPQVRARVARQMGHIQRRVRQLRAANTNLERATEYAVKADDQPEQIRILIERALVSRLGRNPSNGLQHLRSALDLARQRTNGGPRYMPRILVAQGMVQTTLRQWVEAELTFSQAYASAAEQEFELWKCWIDYRRAQMYFQSERADLARESATIALSGFSGIQHRYGTAHTRLLLGRIYLRAGQFVAARASLEDALETFRNCGDRFIEGNTAAELASVHLAEGSVQHASAALRRARRLRTDQHYWVTSARILAAMLRQRLDGDQTSDQPLAPGTIPAGF